jgi:hypothetical protein
VWFIPGLMAIGSLAIVWAALQVRFDLESAWWLHRGSAQDASELLSSLLSSLITMATLTTHQASLNTFDLVVTVALGSTLATVLLSKNVALAEGVLAMALLVFFQFAPADFESWSTASAL